MKKLLSILLICVCGCNSVIKAPTKLDSLLQSSRYSDTAIYYLSKQSDAISKEIKYGFGTDGVKQDVDKSHIYGDSARRYWSDSITYFVKLADKINPK